MLQQRKIDLEAEAFLPLATRGFTRLSPAIEQFRRQRVLCQHLRDPVGLVTEQKRDRSVAPVTFVAGPGAPGPNVRDHSESPSYPCGPPCRETRSGRTGQIRGEGRLR